MRAQSNRPTPWTRLVTALLMLVLTITGAVGPMPAQAASGTGRVYDTKAIQQMLRLNRSLVSEPHGIYDENTVSAVFAYQRMYQLGIDGMVGPETYRSMVRRFTEQYHQCNTGRTEDAHFLNCTDIPIVQPSNEDRPNSLTRRVQVMLKLRGHDIGEADGTYGPLTRAAVRQFQETHFLTPTGEVDRTTYGELTASYTGVIIGCSNLETQPLNFFICPKYIDQVIEPESDVPSDYDLAYIQDLLRYHGYYSGTIDGLMGPETRNALRAFQASAGLAQTRMVDEATFEALVRRNEAEFNFCQQAANQADPVCLKLSKPKAETYDASNLRIFIDGNLWQPNVPPFTEDGRTLVPFRSLLMQLGIPDDENHIVWQQDTQTAIATDGNHKIVVQADNAIAWSNGWNFQLEAPARLRYDRTFLPLRFVAESFGARVDWLEGEHAVKIQTHTPPDLTPGQYAAAAQALWPMAYACQDSGYCISKDAVINVTPAMFQAVRAHLPVVWAIKQAHGLQKREYTAADVGRLTLGLAAPQLIEEIFPKTLPRTGPGLRVVPPIPPPVPAPIPAPLVAILLTTAATLGGDSGPVERLLEAPAREQVSWGLKADVYRLCTLKAGDFIYGGLPGQSKWYTNWDTVQTSGFDAPTLWKLLQVPPNPKYGTFRNNIGKYRVKTTITVPCGLARNNPSWPGQLADGSNVRLRSGEGGGFQYWVDEWAQLLEQVDTSALVNHIVKDWLPYLLK